MSFRLLHGLLLGALIASVSVFLELFARLQVFPYHRDFAAFRLWLPKYAFVGSLIGLLAAIILPWISRSADRARQPGLHLTVGILGLISVLVMAPRGLPVDSLQPLLFIELKAVLVAVSVYLLGYAFTRSKYAWVLASYTTPWFSVVALSLIFAMASMSDRLSPWPAPGSTQNLAPAAGESAATSPPPQSPNVLLVVLDGVGAAHLGCYGNHRSTSPELDRLASESVLFENAFAAAPWTLPSQASLFTGLQQSSHGVGWEHMQLANGSDPGVAAPNHDAWTLAEELASRGFQTCGISDSKWLTSEHGLSQGFQHYFDFQTKSVPERLFLARLFRDLSLFEDQKVWESSGQRIVQTALDWLAEPHMRKEDQPFFMFVNLNQAEPPFAFPPSFKDSARFLPPGMDPAKLSAAYLATAETRRSFNLGNRALEEQEAEIQKGLYDAAILYQDQLLGNLVEGLRALDLLEDTVVVFVSNHGEEFNEQSRFGDQCSLSDRVLHVPFLIRYPSLLPAGRRVPDLVSLVDVFPTVLGILQSHPGAPSPVNDETRALEGFDLSELAKGKVASPRDWILAQYQNPARFLFRGSRTLLTSSSAWKARSITTLRSADSKYFRFGDGSQAFLDLARDPDENAAENTTISAEDRAIAASYSKSLQQLENWLITRRTILLSQQDPDETWSIPGTDVIAARNLLAMPSSLFLNDGD